MSASVKTAAPKVSNRTYRIAGKTLKEVHDDMKRRQPGGSDGVASCDTGIGVPAVSKFDETEESAVVEYTVSAKAGLTVTLAATITLPELTTRNQLSSAARAEWDRFLAKLSAHEKEHLAVAQKVAEELADELGALQGHGTAKDKAGAIAAAQKDYVEQYRKAFAAADISKRIEDAHKKLDAKGNTFTLNLDIP